MKRLSVLAMVMVVMASCAKENIQPKNEPTGEKALLEIGLASTKTQLGTEDKVNNLFPIVWSDGDEIAVIENMGVKGKQNVSVYRLKEGAGTANGVFEHVSGDAFPKVINDVVYPASAVVPNSTLISDIPIVNVSSLVPKDQTQSYETDNFDKNAAVMYFHRNNSADKIILEPLSSIICIPIKGFDDNDVVTAVKWQNMDGRTATVTLNCPNGVTLSKGQATNFYLSIQPMLKDCNGIAYVYLKNGAIQVKTPRNLKAFKAGTLHRFPEWTLSKKAKWSILAQGSERDNDTYKGVPYGPAKYMIDGNDVSWWEFRRELNATKTGPKMAGPHTMVIDLGSKQTINQISIKSKEIKTSPSYGITYTDKNGKTVDIYGSQSFNPPHTFHIAFSEQQPTKDEIDQFVSKKIWPETVSNKNDFTGTGTIDSNYGADKTKWWDNTLKQPVTARYLFIHFEKAWDNAGTKPAASMMKVAELDINNLHSK